MLIGSTTTTVSAGRIMARTGRYKLFPVVGLALMAVGLFLLSRMDAATTRLIASLFMLVFGLGFGMVSQVLVVAVQNAVDRPTSAPPRRPPTSSARSAGQSAWRAFAPPSPGRWAL